MERKSLKTSFASGTAFSFFFSSSFSVVCFFLCSCSFQSYLETNYLTNCKLPFYDESYTCSVERDGIEKTNTLHIPIPHMLHG